MVTLKDIASKCGVDISTVSKVIHGREIRVSKETRAKILDAADELHYRPNATARSLRMRRSGAIAMAVTNTTRYVYPEIIEGAQEKAEELGVCLFVYCYSPRRHEAESLIDLAHEGRFDGVMFHDVPDDRFISELLDAEVPFISLNRYASVGRRFVSLDDEAGFRAQANYLADLGHRKIGFVGVRPDSDIPGDAGMRSAMRSQREASPSPPAFSSVATSRAWILCAWPPKSAQARDAPPRSQPRVW